VAGTANIVTIGGIGVAQIDTTGATPSPGTTQPKAVFAAGGSPADQWFLNRQCPFGAQIIITGLPSVSFKYRVWVQKVGSFSPIALTDPITITDKYGNSSSYSPGPDRFFTYLGTDKNFEMNLAYWYSSGDDLWNVWLELADTSDTVLSTTPQYLIQLDNTPPVVDIHITAGAGATGSGDCEDTPAGTTISGTFIADDLHFGGWSLSTEPNTASTPSNTPIAGPPPPPVVPTLANTDPAPAPAGHVWTLDTASPVAMKPCGYVVRLDVSDRSILISVPYDHNSNSIEVGFCLHAADAAD
jgi:hypothetical protein